jgi:hypothetical protein
VPTEIEFPNIEPTYDFDRDCLSFRARVDSQPVECLVTAELLLARFGARDMTEEAMREAYREHRTEIQDIARSHIANGWIDEEARIFLTTRFTRLSVTFNERLDQWAIGRAAAEAAHQMLTKIIGPNAEEVIVEWDGGERLPGDLLISFRIADPSVPFSVKVSLGPAEWQDRTALNVWLAGNWGAILRARSRKLLVKLG